MGKHDEQLDFDAIDAHVKKALKSRAFRDSEPRGLMTSDAAAKALDPAEVLNKVCAVYRGVRPILIGLAWIPFIPGSWKRAMAKFQSVLDGLCPSEE